MKPGMMIGTKWSLYDDPYADAIANYLKTDENIMMEVGKMYWEKSNLPKIKKVIFNNPATIIIWSDKTKTVVKCTENDVWDAEKGFVMAYLKKIIGVAKLKKEIKKWVIPQEEAEEEFSKNIADHLNSLNDFIKPLGSLLVDIFNGKNSEE